MKSTDQTNFQNIRIAQKSDAIPLALLHKKALKTSYLSKLGSDFLESMYSFLISKEIVFVYTEEQSIVAFVSFSKNSSHMMKSFLLSSPRSLFILAKLVLKKPSISPRLIETYLAPFKIKDYNLATFKVPLPNSELLSIAVEPQNQTRGIGIQLLNVLETHLKFNQINRYKVIAGIDLLGANKFYSKNGFKLSSQINIHGDNISNVYVKEL